MNGKYLLDTNVVIALFASERSVMDHLAVTERIFVSCVVMGELHFGAQRSGRPLQNIARIDAFAEQSIVLSCDAETARHYGEVKNLLRKKGQPIPENDVWIAATALQHGLTLATRDPHFDAIEGLQVEAW